MERRVGSRSVDSRGRWSGCPLTYLFYFTVGSLRAETLPVRLL